MVIIQSTHKEEGRVTKLHKRTCLKLICLSYPWLSPYERHFTPGFSSYWHSSGVCKTWPNCKKANRAPDCIWHFPCLSHQETRTSAMELGAWPSPAYSGHPQIYQTRRKEGDNNQPTTGKRGHKHKGDQGVKDTDNNGALQHLKGEVPLKVPPPPTYMALHIRGKSAEPLGQLFDVYGEPPLADARAKKGWPCCFQYAWPFVPSWDKQIIALSPLKMHVHWGVHIQYMYMWGQEESYCPNKCSANSYLKCLSTFMRHICKYTYEHTFI